MNTSNAARFAELSGSSVSAEELAARLLATGRMSNFDHEIDDGFEAELRAGKTGTHAGWNFHGSYVWYDAKQELFYEAVFVFNQLRAVMSNATLLGLMNDVSDQFGWD